MYSIGEYGGDGSAYEYDYYLLDNPLSVSVDIDIGVKVSSLKKRTKKKT